MNSSFKRPPLTLRPPPTSQKSEDNLGLAESELDKQNNVVVEMTRKVGVVDLAVEIFTFNSVIGGGTASQSERSRPPEGQVG